MKNNCPRTILEYALGQQNFKSINRCDSSHGLGFINQHIWYPDKCVNFVWYQYKQDTLFELLCCGKFPVELGSVTLKINNQQRERESNQAPHFVAVPSLVLNVRNGPLGLFVSYFCN